MKKLLGLAAIGAAVAGAFAFFRGKKKSTEPLAVHDVEDTMLEPVAEELEEAEELIEVIEEAIVESDEPATV